MVEFIECRCQCANNEVQGNKIALFIQTCIAGGRRPDSLPSPPPPSVPACILIMFQFYYPDWVAYGRSDAHLGCCLGSEDTDLIAGQSMSRCIRTEGGSCPSAAMQPTRSTFRNAKTECQMKHDTQHRPDPARPNTESQLKQQATS